MNTNTTRFINNLPEGLPSSSTQETLQDKIPKNDKIPKHTAFQLLLTILVLFLPLVKSD